MTTADLLCAARAVKPAAAALSTAEKNRLLEAMAQALLDHADNILAANAADVEAARGVIAPVMIDRLSLSPARVESMAEGMRAVAALPDPVGELLSETARPNGLVIRKVRVPMGVYGLMPDDDVHLNGYFGEYLVIRKGSTFFNVSGMTLDQRILVEPAAVVVHSLERAKSTGLLKFNSVVLVQGCGPIGLLQIATLRTLGIETIIAVDGNDSRLELAREMGASRTYNFTRYADLNELLDAVKKDNGGRLADFVFQCTGVGKAGANAWKFVKRGGGLCEVGFFMDGGESVINHHYDLCNKEVTAVGSWVYSPQDYPTTFDFLKRAYGIGLPLTKLISHRFKLDEIAEALETNVQMKGIKIAVICG